jgi:hypothetical protein
LASRPLTPIAEGDPAHVLVVGDWFKMGRIDAGPVEAEVIELHPLRDRTNKKFEGRPMGKLRAPVVSVEPAIPSLQVTEPCPTSARLSHDSIPEPISF